ncbi:hypothetical protein [Pseudoduganella sp. R-34]|uniref:hypothetical protein n=1 Tax=unclassified Pseudoduganella TaxID=2637179 RepID=UPI003CEEFAFB
MKRLILPLALMLAGSAHAAANWQIKPEGLGPYKVGARYENLGKTFGGLEADSMITEDKVCRVARSKRYPKVEVTFVKKVLVRVDVSGGFGADRGVRIGDPVSKLQRVYGDAVRPHPQHADWLMVETGDRELAVRYITLDGKVKAIHAGKRLQLQTEGGCDK